MKLVLTHYVAAMHFQMALGKPFNPILGETFQSKSGNSLFYAEQTTHHPPRTNFYIKNTKFVHHGHIAPEATGSVNSITAHIGGKFIIDYSDGGQYKITYPGFSLMGLMIGRRYLNFEGALKIEDTVLSNFNLLRKMT
jgi:hypothetical protein